MAIRDDLPCSHALIQIASSQRKVRFAIGFSKTKEPEVEVGTACLLSREKKNKSGSSAAAIVTHQDPPSPHGSDAAAVIYRSWQPKPAGVLFVPRSVQLLRDRPGCLYMGGYYESSRGTVIYCSPVNNYGTSV